MNTTAKPEQRIVVSLSGSELNRLKKMILGYGKFRQTLEKVEMPETTFRDILKKGYGYPENIKKIREALLEIAA